jgi:hypothetical protein
MKTTMKIPAMGDQTAEFAICFFLSLVLIFHFFVKPDPAITNAVVDNDVLKVRQMIHVSRKDADEPGRCRQTRSFYSTPLIQAAWLGRTEIALELLNAGVNVNARDEYGTTPLMAALSRGDIQMSLLLLGKGADPNLPTCLGHGSCTMPLRCARRLDNAKLISKIESVGGREDTTFFFPAECFWLDARPVALLVVTRIIPLIFCVMLTGSFIRRRCRKNRRS